MLIQLVIILFVGFAVWRLVQKFKNQEISKKEFGGWLFFCLLVFGGTIWFRKTDIIAQFLGVEKGADLAVYFSVLVLFYLVFKILVKIDRIERNITKITREIALREKKGEE